MTHRIVLRSCGIRPDAEYARRTGVVVPLHCFAARLQESWPQSPMEAMMIVPETLFYRPCDVLVPTGLEGARVLRYQMMARLERGSVGGRRQRRSMRLSGPVCAPAVSFRRSVIPCRNRFSTGLLRELDANSASSGGPEGPRRHRRLFDARIEYTGSAVPAIINRFSIERKITPRTGGGCSAPTVGSARHGDGDHSTTW